MVIRGVWKFVDGEGVDLGEPLGGVTRNGTDALSH